MSREPYLRTARKLLVALLFAVLPMAAQTGLGTVKGTVTDSTHAVIPNANVLLTNSATGVADRVQSTAVGAFYFGAVKPGPYKLAVEVSQFKKWTTAFTVEVGQTVTVDPALEVGGEGTSIVVVDAAPIITTDGGQVSDVKDALRIHELPLNGRQISQLFSTSAGVEGGSAPRVNGMKVGSTEMLLDGVSLLSRFGGGLSSAQPGLDTVQEYRVESAGSSAQYTQPSTVTLMSKSGTNELHGSVFETFRNNFGGLVARARQDGNSTPPKYIRNEYGASAGGAIIKNKTFWFASYEGMKLRQKTYAETQMPSADIWNGDFSGATNTNGQAITIYDPLTSQADGSRMPFAGNRIPTDRLSTIAKTMQTVSAPPNVPGANPWTDINFTTYYPLKTDFSTYTGKIDHVFSEKDSISGRFTKSLNEFSQAGGRYGFPPNGVTNANGTSAQESGLYSIFARWNRVFTPTLLNEFQASGNRAPNHQGTLADSTNWATKLGLPNPFGATGWPTIYTDDSAFFYYGGWDSDNKRNQNMTAYQVEDNVTWIKGTHTLKFGFRGRKELNNVQELQQAEGSHDFYHQWTALYDAASDGMKGLTGSGLATLELGLPTTLRDKYNRGYFYFRQAQVGLYAQDTWRVSPRLTLDYGIRWDRWAPYQEKYNRMVNIDLDTYANTFQVITPGNATMESLPGVPSAVLATYQARGLSWTTADQAGFPSALLNPDNLNFSPRLGLAYRINDKNVLRVGYGTYHWTMPLGQILQTSRTNPPLNLTFMNDLASNNNVNTPNYALTHAPQPSAYADQATVDINGAQILGGDPLQMMPWDARNWKDATMQTWTFTFERHLMKETALRLSYIGNHGSNLEQRWNWNSVEADYNYATRTGLARPSNTNLMRANPNWDGSYGYTAHNGYSNTHTLQAELERRFSNGLSFQTFYTFARSLSTSDADGSSSGNGGMNNVGKGDGAGSTFMVPQNINLPGVPNLTPDQLLRLGYSNSSAVPSHHVRWNGIYDLPFGKGKKFGNTASGVVNTLIGGWQIAFNGDWRSGFWMGVDTSMFLFGDPSISADQRPVMTVFNKQQRLWFKGYFDPTKANIDITQFVPVDPNQRVFRQLNPADGNNTVPVRLANGQIFMANYSANMVNWNARNFLKGPGAWNQDASLFKTIPIRERYRLRLTGDFFNAFNHPNDNSPNQKTGLQDLSRQSNAPRTIQLSARVEW